MGTRPSSLQFALRVVQRSFPRRLIPWVAASALLVAPGACEPIDAHAGLEFSPCPKLGPCKILPLGDSITAGMEQTAPDQYDYLGGYRVPLFELAVKAGKDITFVGSREPNGPEMVAGLPFPGRHEGWNGAVIQSLKRKDIDYGALPHIVLLHVGTNDMNGKYADEAPDDLADFIDQVTSALPHALVVVAKIVPRPRLADKVNAYNAAMAAIVAERARAGAHVVLVDQFTGYPAGKELPDAVHPNAAGYRRMAGVWYEAIAEYLPDAPESQGEPRRAGEPKVGALNPEVTARSEVGPRIAAN